MHSTHCWSPTPSPHPGSSRSRSRHPLYGLPNSCPSTPYSDKLSGFGAHNYLHHSAGHWDASASDPRTRIATWLESPLEPQACSSVATEPIPSDFLFAADPCSFTSDICVFDGNTDDLSIGVDDHLHQLSSLESTFTTEATDWPGWDPTGASMVNMYYLAEFFSNASAADMLGIPTRTASDSFGSGTHWAQSAPSFPDLTSLVDDTPPSILSSSVPDKSSPWEPVAAIKCSNCPALRSETRHIYHQFSKTALCSACYTFQLKSKGTEPRPVYLELKRAVRRAKKASAVAKLKKKDCSHCASSLVPVVRKPHRPCKGN